MSEKSLYEQAVALVAGEQKCSISMVQRHFQLSYNEAARLVERMEREGIVSEADETGKRKVFAP